MAGQKGSNRNLHCLTSGGPGEKKRAGLYVALPTELRARWPGRNRTGDQRRYRRSNRTLRCPRDQTIRAGRKTDADFFPLQMGFEPNSHPVDRHWGVLYRISYRNRRNRGLRCPAARRYRIRPGEMRRRQWCRFRGVARIGGRRIRLLRCPEKMFAAKHRAADMQRLKKLPSRRKGCFVFRKLKPKQRYPSQQK